MTPHRRVCPAARGSLRTLAVIAAVVGCGHSDSFTSPPYGTDAPFDPAPPVRLTFNSMADRGAAWLPDGSGILYSAQQLARADADVCLALLPPTGGRQVKLTCDLTTVGVDSTNSIESAAPAADGRLAFVESSSRVGALTPNTTAIAIAPGLDPFGAPMVQPVPYVIPGEPAHTGVAFLRWLGDDRLAFLAGSVAYPHSCPMCTSFDTVFSGLKVVTLDAAAGAKPAAVPGTDFASGVSAGAGADEIFYTIGGDSRVFRRALSTGETAVAYDFGTAGIARDVHVVGNRMAAVVGGRVAFGIDPALGTVQRDSGGVVHVVDLTTGADRTLDTGGLLFRRPALAPDAGSLVAEGHQLIDVGGRTIVGDGDLYLFGAP